MSDLFGEMQKAIDSVLGEDHESLSIEMGCGTVAAKLREEAMVRATRAVMDVLVAHSRREVIDTDILEAIRSDERDAARRS